MRRVDTPHDVAQTYSVLIKIGDVESLGEVLAQEVAGAALKGLAVLHHRLDGVGVERTGETLRLALHALNDGNGHPLFGKLGVDLQHLLSLLLSLLAGGVSRVAFLPQKFRRAQERTCAHLPAHDVTPLVAHQRQVAPRVNPVLIRVPDDGLTRRADNQLLFKLGSGVYHNAALVLGSLQTVVCHHGALLGEALHVLSLAREERFRNQQGEVGVLGARLLEHLV